MKCCTAQAAWQSQPAVGFAADLLHLQCLQSHLKHKERPECSRQDVVLVCRPDFSTAMSQDSGSLMVACMGWSICLLLSPLFRTMDLDLSDGKLILTQKDGWDDAPSYNPLSKILRSDSKPEVPIIAQEEFLDLTGCMVAIQGLFDEFVGNWAICTGPVTPKQHKISLP